MNDGCNAVTALVWVAVLAFPYAAEYLYSRRKNK